MSSTAAEPYDFGIYFSNMKDDLSKQIHINNRYYLRSSCSNYLKDTSKNQARTCRFSLYLETFWFWINRKATMYSIWTLKLFHVMPSLSYQEKLLYDDFTFSIIDLFTKDNQWFVCLDEEHFINRSSLLVFLLT